MSECHHVFKKGKFKGQKCLKVDCKKHLKLDIVEENVSEFIKDCFVLDKEKEVELPKECIFGNDNVYKTISSSNHV